MNPVKNIIVYYFSGTGNAKQIALWLKHLALTESISCVLFDIAETEVHKISNFNSEDLIFLISPIHGFNYPKITLSFIEHFPKGKNRIILMNTRAGMKIGRWVTPGLTGIAFLLASYFFKRKGYQIVGQVPFDMPSNWISVHPALNDPTVKYIHEKNFERLKKHAQKIFAGEKDFWAYRELLQDILISPISLGYYLIGRYFFAKSFYATEDCDNCGLCEKKCPVQAIITVDDRPYWTFKCESCMHCMNFCPKNAIETAHGLLVLISFLSSFLITLALSNFYQAGLENGWLRFTLFSIIFIPLLWVLYRFQHVLLRKKWIAQLISYTSLTRLKFWGRYRSIPDYKWKKKPLKTNKTDK